VPLSARASASRASQRLRMLTRPEARLNAAVRARPPGEQRLSAPPVASYQSLPAPATRLTRMPLESIARSAGIAPRTMIERFIERTLYASRWLLAPLYLGLALGLIALGIKFFQHAFHAIVHIIAMEEADLVLVVLALIDISLVGSLVVMVMFSGYENFVSRIDAANENEMLGWLGKLDSGTLKLKVAASIVAISSIHLLRMFMKAQEIANDKLMWYVILHLTFVVSAVLLGVLDKMSFASHRDEPSAKHS
jgi:uncharacterized protein (TIGR00645 family)